MGEVRSGPTSGLGNSRRQREEQVGVGEILSSVRDELGLRCPETGITRRQAGTVLRRVSSGR